ncbi:2OG-Fe(II) oxygenase [Candidatus Binatia bacterium]|nr:2OG-Fe(II) oxygenase [Candidatus Binatia bacterium]
MSPPRTGAADPHDLATHVLHLADAEHLAALDERGHVVLERVLDRASCRAIGALYADEARFRSRVVMARHGFGRGEYKYLAYPLPDTIAVLRAALYPPLAALANAWSERLGRDTRYPASLDQWLERCHAAGQTRPTPLLLRYAAGDWNCLHQDLYGDLVFPLQVAILLSAPGGDFTGGELVLTEQRPRQQSRVHVVPLAQGDAVVFAVRDRPVRGSRGFYRAGVRHGVSELRSGERTTLGLIFHDAR